MSVFARMAPLTAAVAALSALLCCLPLAFGGALGTAALGAIITPLSSWLAGASVALVGFGLFQLYRRGPTCSPKRRSTVIVTWAAAVLVFLLLAMPQLAASLIADWLS